MTVRTPGEASLLIVDDEQEILHGIRDFLLHLFPGIRITTATSADEGLKVLAGGGIDVVMADYKMPGKDGLQMLEEAARRMPAIPRILFTAYPDLDVAVRALNEARIRWFLLKPIDPATLGGILAQILAENWNEAGSAGSGR